jgi:hypothetical protein
MMRLIAKFLRKSGWLSNFPLPPLALGGVVDSVVASDV